LNPYRDDQREDRECDHTELIPDICREMEVRSEPPRYCYFPVLYRAGYCPDCGAWIEVWLAE
jgi:hypothetical protein